MSLVLLFLAASALFTATAIPTRPPQPEGSSSGSNADYVPKVDFKADYRFMPKNDRAAATNLVINHYKGLEPENEQKKAKLAFVPHFWHDGGGPEDEHRQYLAFNYHQGDHQNSPKIGQTVTIARDRPPPESHFSQAVARENKLEIASEMNKKYRALPPDFAKHVRAMKVDKDWGEGRGFREETRMTFHSNARPTGANIIGSPVPIYRPMSFLVDDAVPEKQVPVIKSRIRQEHENLHANHPLKQANYAVVTEGWHSIDRRKALHVEATMYKMKDQLSGNPEVDYERMGELHVPLGKGHSSTTAGPSTGKRKRD